MKGIQLSDHFDYRKLLCFAVPSILMMIVTSIYGVVDGFFVSNFAGKSAFAAINFIMPFVMILGGMGFMIGAGGSALIGKSLGEENPEKANRLFSMLVYAAIAIGLVIGIAGVLFVETVAGLLGADEEMRVLCGQYGRIVLCGVPFVMLQFAFHSFFVTAQKPKLGLYSSLFCGTANIALDALLVGVFHLGIMGAAVATVISQIIGGSFPLIYFSHKNSSLLKLGKTTWDGKAFLKTISNGASEFVTNVAMSVVGMVYNVQLLKYLGQNGVAAYGVLMYLGLLLSAVFMGFSTGTAPVISFHFGAEDKAELKNLLKKGIIILEISSIVMFVLTLLLSRPISSLFVGYDEELMAITRHAFKIYAFSFLFSPLAIYGSSFFTALNDGLTSAVISFNRTFVFELGTVLLLPLIFGIDGIWLSIVAAEFSAAAISLIFLFTKKAKYGY